MDNKLWYKNSSLDWMEGLPLGNGRLAAMLTGSDNTDILSLNHEWLWKGIYKDRDNISARHMLKPVRELIEKGDFYRATMLANTFFGGESGGISGLPCRIDSYQPVGDLKLEFKNSNKFCKRQLDIINGVAETERLTEKGKVNAVYAAHAINKNIICHIDGETDIELSFLRETDESAFQKYEVSDKSILYNCKFNRGTEFAVKIDYLTDAVTEVCDKSVRFSNGSYLTIFVNIATDVMGIEKELNAFSFDVNSDIKSCLVSHKKSFSEVMNGFSFKFDCDEVDIPTDERIKNLKNGQKDDELTLLYYNYGRYLLVSSSLGADLPANLQGKWNASLTPPWECDYHFDINLQMNYWMAEAVNLADCVKPLISYCESFKEHGRKAAMDLYGCRGIYIPLSSDGWAKATVEHTGWGVWIGAAPWLARHFWEHYIYSCDKEFLSEHAYPFFKEIALFYEDYLVKDKDGIYQIMPSQSPENGFEGTGSIFEVSIGKSSAMDVQLAYDLLGYAVRSAEILKIDKDDAEKWSQIREKLPEFRVGSDGRLLEWDCERKETDPGHRHLSHLYGVYPSDIFNEETNAEQFEAAKKSFDFRMKNGGGYTGWSRAWCACLCARFADSEKVYENISEMIKEFATASLLDLHPPGIFQIDGNLGAVAAVTEAAAQFVGGKLYLLKALPKQWGNGSIENLRVPGGHKISFVWESGVVKTVNITVGMAESLELCVNGKKIMVSGVCGDVKELNF